jgi:hypothetical protein
MELSILVNMVLVLGGCLVGVALIAGGVGVVLLVSGQGFGRSLQGAWWLGIFPWLTAAGMLACLSGFMVPTLDVQLNGVDATGTVVDYAVSNNEGASYSSIVEFETADGRTIRFEDTAVSSNPPRHEIGQTVPVRYKPDNPDLAIIGNDFTIWIVAAVLLVVAAVVTPVMALIGWRRYQQAI